MEAIGAMLLDVGNDGERWMFDGEDKENHEDRNVSNSISSNVQTEAGREIETANGNATNSSNVMNNPNASFTNSEELQVDKQLTGIENCINYSSMLHVASEYRRIDASSGFKTSSLLNSSDLSEARHGRKRSFDDVESTDVIENGDLSQHTSCSCCIVMKKRLLKLERKLKELEEQSTRKKNDSNNTDNDLHHRQTQYSSNNSISIDDIVKILGISQVALESCHRKRATATSRNILKYKFSNAKLNMTFSEVDSSIVHSIISN